MSNPDKNARYDRQLRLWAENGQRALEDSRIALIGGNATGSETLKNLVLPGIGSYTIIDGETVTPADTGVNFFLDVDSIGQPRARCVCRYLQELNSDVNGKYIAEDAISLINHDAERFTTEFDVILVADLDQAPLLKLSKVLWSARIPLIIVSSMGFMGYLRIVLPEHTVIESHPEAMVDLRLDAPWQELSKLASDMNLEEMNDNEHTHVPYILLLLHYMRLWKSQHDGKAPTTFAEKTEFKTLIKSGMRNVDEDNFDEAVSNVWRACSTTNISSEVRAVLDDPAAQNLTSDSSDFWFLARAVSDFVKFESANLLPVCGVVPDMKSDTTTYITLQQVYRAKAKLDVDKVKGYLQKHLEANHRHKDQIADRDIEVFCKHAAFLKVLRYRSIEQELQKPNEPALEGALSESDSPVYFYLAKRLADTYISEHGSFPDGIAIEEDASLSTKMSSICGVEVDQVDTALESCKKATQELARAGSGELHNIASFMGGIAAQEIIKVITKQYIPINNTVIFDGIKSVTAVYEF